ncbi:MAG: hypothetical protein ACOY3U_03030 [Bacillota bacterium]|nr:hypothetical protein [Desulforamulus profundi]
MKILSPEERADKFIVGVLYKCEAPEYTAEYQKLQEKFRGK